MIRIVKDGVVCAQIVVQDEPVALFAAQQLQTYIERMSGGLLPIGGNTANDSAVAALFVGSIAWCREFVGDEADGSGLVLDGYMLKRCGKGLIITSHVGRGVLYAAYALLERLGCRWFYPGAFGEYIPTMQDIAIDAPDVQDNPDFETRSFTEDTHKKPADIWKQEMLETIDWCGKNKINSFFIHADPAGEIAHMPEVVAEIKKRGMSFEFGGHGAHNLLDRKLFDRQPELFREVGGERRKDGNLCGANAEAVAHLIEGVRKIVRNNPDVDILHLWFADVLEGSWCDCPLCNNIHPAMQQMNVINQIAERIGQEHAHLKIDMLLYHDTVEVERIACDPAPNAVGFFAPRERCYAHSISDPNCERNQYYYRKLKDALGKFKTNTYVFEYYADLILYREMKISIPGTIGEDLRAYRRLGVSRVSSLMFGRYSWWAYETNMYVFARTAWDADFDYRDGLRQLCDRLYPSTSAQMLRYYDALEAASAGMLSFCGFKGNMQERDIPINEPDFYRSHMAGFRNSMEILKNGMRLLDDCYVDSESSERERIGRNRLMLDITIRATQSIYDQLLGKYTPDKRKSLIDSAVRLIRDNKSAMQAISYEIKGTAGECLYEGLCDNMAAWLNPEEKE